jgi:CRP/FNR family transcriptional regulator, cyclic AMP receptor protein
MIQPSGPEFDIAIYLAHAGLGRRIMQLDPKQTLFSQGDPADSIFYLQNGQAKITVVSQTGKEATIAILNPGEFAGEESLTVSQGCDWPQQQQSLPAAHSRLIEKRWFG